MTAANEDLRPRAVRLRAEHHERPFGIGENRPRLSWQVISPASPWRQRAYRLRTLDEDGEPSRSTEWTDSAEQILLPWPFTPLESRERLQVQVQVASVQGQVTDWSPPLRIEAGLLDPDDWSARAITPDPVPACGTQPDTPAPALRRDFMVGPDLLRARLYTTAHGLYRLSLNGRTVGDELLAPGWTSYHHRLRYQTHDVTAQIAEGANTIGALLGNGWYRGHLGFQGQRALYGDRRALLSQLELHYSDGTVQYVNTGIGWTWAPSHIRSDDLYGGQHTDLRLQSPGWDTLDGRELPGWKPVEEIDFDTRRLFAPLGPPVRRTGTLAPVSVTDSPEGGHLIDFGQNLVGWVRLTVRGGTEGDVVRVRHAEVLQDGALCVRPLRRAGATDTYELADGRLRTLEPEFTFHGFRYAEVSGVNDLAPEDVEAVVVGSDLRRTGWFSCSDPDLERLHENVVWSMRGNFLDVPTDCPQRDERLGWTGDLQVFAPTAAYLYDCAGFLDSWLRDLAADQASDGTVPLVVPDMLTEPGRTPPAIAAWGDAAVITPWVHYQRFGDPEILERHWPAMRAWVERVRTLTHADGLWSTGLQLGDWLDPTAPPEQPDAAQADRYLVSAAYQVRSLTLLAATARVLGYADECEFYEERAERARNAFADRYLTPGGRVVSDCPTAYALVVEFALAPSPEQSAAAGRRLADLVRLGGYRISTGFVGTPLVTDALASTGHTDVAYRLLLQKACPSWLYPITMGATTVWERWDSMLPDGSLNPGEMTSFNHYALGAIADFLHRRVAGLAPTEPGYRTVEVRPTPGGGLTRAAARHEGPYGPIRVEWRVDGDRCHLEVVVPPNSTAKVFLPDGSDPIVVQNGTHSWSLPWPMIEKVELGMGATLREAMDRSGTWERIQGLLIGQGMPEDEAQLFRRLTGHLDTKIADLPATLTSFVGVRDPEVFARDLEKLFTTD